MDDGAEVRLSWKSHLSTKAFAYFGWLLAKHGPITEEGQQEEILMMLWSRACFLVKFGVPHILQIRLLCLLQYRNLVSHQQTSSGRARCPQVSNGGLPSKLAAKQDIIGWIEAKPENNTWTPGEMKYTNKLWQGRITFRSCARRLYRQDVGGKVQTLWARNNLCSMDGG